MANWAEFIGQATQTLGLSEGTAKAATGGILKLIQNKASSDDFAKIKESIPGIDSLLQSAPSGENTGGLSGLLSKITSAFGGSGSSALGLAGMLGQSGLSSEKIAPFVSQLLGFLKTNAGENLVSKLLSSIPDLKKFAG